MNTAFIELQGVEKRFGSRHVLAAVSLAINEGEFVSIVGRSASGKTTLLKIACGLLAPDTGSAILRGSAINKFPRDAAIVFQNYSLLPWLSALENVQLAVESAFPAWSRLLQTEQAQRYLRMVGLGGAFEKRPGQLSGGMRQRVAIARAFAVEPSVLFLDEPFGALDALTRATLQQELVSLCNAAARPVTTLMITNNVDEAILLSDRIYALRPGCGASLSPAVTIPICQPRSVELLLRDEQAICVRAQIADYLLAARRPGVLVGAEA